MAFEITPDVKVKRDRDGIIRQLHHPSRTYAPQPSGPSPEGRAAAVERSPSPGEVADEYLRDVLPAYQLGPDMASNLDAPVTGAMIEEGPRLKRVEEKVLQQQATVSYAQTRLGLPVWQAGLSVQLQTDPYRVTSSNSTVHYDLEVDPPSPDAPYREELIDEQVLARVLNLDPSGPRPRINARRLLIYAFDPNDRGNGATPPEPPDEGNMHADAPKLDLPPLPAALQPGRHYVVVEVLFTFEHRDWGEVNWSAFVEPETGAVLHLRAFIACVDGFVLLRDAPSETGDLSITPTSPPAVLDGLRTRVTLAGLDQPVDRQELRGDFVRLVDVSAPNLAPPTAEPGAHFLFSVPTNEFAAVSAYHHCDGLFRTLQGMGFHVPSYFDGTTFPVRVDHRATIGGASNTVNASAPGNVFGNGSDGFRFALLAANTQVGMAIEPRVTWHEFGHAILWDHLGSPNFPFAHSVGDSLAAILFAPDSNAPDPGRTFPWTIIGRRHDREVGDGWGWGGEQDDPWPVGHPSSGDRAGYVREQILSSTLFLLYRALGGDHQNLAIRRFAARYTIYLIFSACGRLSSVAPAQDAEAFADLLMESDVATLAFEGHPGATAHKVIRWAFEHQGLYQPTGAAAPVTTAGAPPEVDVYVDDGRGGAYTPGAGFVASSQEIWNRRGADGGQQHEEPLPGADNFLYVRVRNRGSSPAQSTVAQAFVVDPQGDDIWPTSWQVLNPTPLGTPGTIAPGGEVVIGPIAWQPPMAEATTVMVSVSTDQDQSNAEIVSHPVPVAQLAYYDNNIALREMTAAAPIA